MSATRAKSPIRSVRLSERQAEFLTMIKAAEGRDAHRRNFKPRKEGAILSSALEVGIAELFRRNVGWWWSCDTCGEEISSVDVGWVEWLRHPMASGDHSFGLRLVHHKHRCMYDLDCLPEEVAKTSEAIGGPNANPRVLDHTLEHFVSDGARLLSLLSTFDWHRPDEVAVLYRRLFLPGFEQVRSFLDEDSQAFADDRDVREALDALAEAGVNATEPENRDHLLTMLVHAERAMGIDDDDKDDDA